MKKKKKNQAVKNIFYLNFFTAFILSLAVLFFTAFSVSYNFSWLPARDFGKGAEVLAAPSVSADSADSEISGSVDFLEKIKDYGEKKLADIAVAEFYPVGDLRIVGLVLENNQALIFFEDDKNSYSAQASLLFIGSRAEVDNFSLKKINNLDYSG